METDQIVEVGIDDSERLYIKPEMKSFPFIYREAMEVNWNEDEKYLYGAKPRKWEYIDWFVQIIDAAKQQGSELSISNECVWVNVSKELKRKIIEKSN